MQFYQFHIGDYAKNTAHLTDEEDLAYRRLLDLYYDTETPLDRDATKVARRVRMAGKEDVIISILEEFFTLKDFGWFHPVCDKNIKSYNKMRDAGKKTAAKRWKNKDKLDYSPPIAPLQGGNTPGNDGANANHKPITINQEPETINHKPIDNFFKSVSRPATHEEVKTARAGDFGNDPLLIDCDILPNGWYDLAYESGLDDRAIMNKFRYMRDRHRKPLARDHWVNIVNYKGASHG